MTIFSLAGRLVTGTGTANAETCTHPAWPDKDKSGSGTVTGPNIYLHTGPETVWSVITGIYPGALLWYHCFTINRAGHTWTNVRVTAAA